MPANMASFHLPNSHNQILGLEPTSSPYPNGDLPYTWGDPPPRTHTQTHTHTTHTHTADLFKHATVGNWSSTERPIDSRYSHYFPFKL